MISEFENLSLGGNNAASNHGDPFTHTGKIRSVSNVDVEQVVIPILTWPQWLGLLLHFYGHCTVAFRADTWAAEDVDWYTSKEDGVAVGDTGEFLL